MTCKARETDGKQDYDLTDTILGQSFNDKITKSLLSCMSDRQTDFHGNYSVSNDQGHDSISRSQLSMVQHKDPDISVLFDRDLDEKELSQVPVCYYVKT